jgi:DNA-directed RNA polymerase specialized sigma24 family protein
VTSRERRLALQLEAEQAGTLLGAIAWVLGALQIMKDRGHAEGDEEFHELYDELQPRLEALVARISGAQLGLGADDAMQQEIEAAYAPMHEAFKTWIQQTASDTFSVAVGQRLGEVLDEAEEGAEAEGGEEGE